MKPIWQNLRQELFLFYSILQTSVLDVSFLPDQFHVPRVETIF